MADIKLNGTPVSGRTLAEQVMHGTDQYFWYPNKTEEEMKTIRKEVEEKSNGNKMATMFYLEGFVHQDGYTHWKYALVNRTQAFSKPGFVFYDDNIRRFCKEAKGFILHVKDSPLLISDHR